MSSLDLRRFGPALLALMGLALSLTAWRFTARWERDLAHEHVRSAIQGAGRGQIAAVDRALVAQLAVLEGLASFFEGSTEVEREEFATFVAGPLHRYPGIVALEWAPRVKDEDLASWVQRARAVSLPTLELKEVDGEGVAQPHRPGLEHFPILYSEPFAENEAAIGLDLISEDARRETLEQAGRSGTVAVSPGLRLVQSKEHSHGDMLGAMPVFEHGAPTTTPEQKHEALRGYVVEVFRTSEVLVAAQAASGCFGAKPGSESACLELQLYGPGAEASLMGLGGVSAQGIPTDPVPYADFADGIFVERPLEVGGRTWLAVVRLVKNGVSTPRSPIAWLVLISGLVLTALATALFARITGESAKVAQQVALRTAEVEQATRELSQRESHLRAIFDATQDGIIVLDPQGRVRSLNAATERIFGYSSAELVGGPFHRLLGEDLALPSHELVRRSLSGNQPLVSANRREVSGLKSDGATVPLDLTQGPLHMEEGIGTLLVVRDLTEGRAVQRMKDGFVSTVSHELRTPLTSILGSLDLLREGVAGPLAPEVARLVEMAYSNSERLLRIINDILDIERLRGDRVRLALEQVSAETLLEEARTATQGYAKMNGVELHLLPLPIGCHVDVDRGRIVQVLTNLVGNAIKFSERGAVVDLGVECEEHSVVFLVRDRGPGIPVSFRSEVFSPFSRADMSNARQVSGTGLGLSIARALVEAHGGTIWFETEISVGTIFRFRLGRGAGGGVAP